MVQRIERHTKSWIYTLWTSCCWLWRYNSSYCWGNSWRCSRHSTLALQCYPQASSTGFPQASVTLKFSSPWCHPLASFIVASSTGMPQCGVTHRLCSPWRHPQDLLTLTLPYLWRHPHISRTLTSPPPNFPATGIIKTNQSHIRIQWWHLFLQMLQN